MNQYDMFELQAGRIYWHKRGLLIHDVVTYVKAIKKYLEAFKTLIEKAEHIVSGSSTLDQSVHGVNYEIFVFKDSKLHSGGLSDGLNYNTFYCENFGADIVVYSQVNSDVFCTRMHAPVGHLLLPKTFSYNPWLTYPTVVSDINLAESFHLFQLLITTHSHRSVSAEVESL